MMFGDNDEKLLKFRGAVVVFLAITAAVGALAGLSVVLNGDGLGLVIILAAFLAAWIGWIFWEFVFSVCYDIKCIRNKLYGEPPAFEDFRVNGENGAANGTDGENGGTAE